MGVQRPLSLAALAVALLGVQGGCKYTSNDVDTWKGTVKGPAKMEAVMLAPKYGVSLRTYAALSLVEMDRQDVNGVDMLEQGVGKLDSQTRTKIIDGLAPGLIELMSRAGEADEDPTKGPPAHQIRAKDAAFGLLDQATPSTRKKLMDAVIRWYTDDFNGRNLSGDYSAEQVVRALGSPAAALLVDALQSKLPQQALVKLAELIGQLGNPEAKQRAAQKLVDIEREMEGETFLKWLSAEIEAQLKDAGQEITPDKVQKAAALNRDKWIESGALPAMKHLADQEQIATRLLQIAADPSTAPDRRTRALQALEGGARKEHLDQLLALALNNDNPASVRDYAFDRVGDIRSPRAIAPMWPLVQDAQNQRLRWRAGELVLAIGGNGVLAEFFSKLPDGDGVSYEPEELEGYAQRMAQMSPLPRKVALAQLQSPDWWDRIIALRFFQRKGTEADIARMQQLSGNSASVKGKNWKKGETVGSVAREAAAGLRERLKHTGGTSPNQAEKPEQSQTGAK